MNGCFLAPNAQNCWVPVGRSNRCVQTKSVAECKLPVISESPGRNQTPRLRAAFAAGDG